MTETKNDTGTWFFWRTSSWSTQNEAWQANTDTFDTFDIVHGSTRYFSRNHPHQGRARPICYPPFLKAVTAALAAKAEPLFEHPVAATMATEKQQRTAAMAINIKHIGFWLGDYDGVAEGGCPYRWGGSIYISEWKTFIVLIAEFPQRTGTGCSPPYAAHIAAATFRSTRLLSD
jgi:hypothetical protein